MLVSIALKVLILSKMKRMQHPVTRTEDKKQQKSERDRLKPTKACMRKETE